ncbi:hypothetical protein [Occallatibacter riparius]|uniref:Uncharacterized protein n=1 Tax=Occallatibacter riparius TaxID=1002689 RepID=A0A9J7BF96_9BACT|nr:hypothetical protein [Occallatibacter riparius]UWZ81684.1 hypothetical protein MOP44_13935 [Occallatibacter riparius]
MNSDHHAQQSTARRRRYVLHLSCMLEPDSDKRRYLVRIRPSVSRSTFNQPFGQRAFEDDCELIAAINPLLPVGSDVRDVFGHIEATNGFFYVVWLSDEEAQGLGWNDEDTAS